MVRSASSVISACCKLSTSRSWRGRTHAEKRGSTQRATPRGIDCGYRVKHVAMSDSSRSICATAATALIKHHRDCSVAWLSVQGRGVSVTSACRFPRRVVLRNRSTLDAETALLILRRMGKALLCLYTCP